MFTLGQIKAVQATVKSGADYPAYAAALTRLGLTHYVTEVSDGSSTYYGPSQEPVSGGPLYAPLAIASVPSQLLLKQALQRHQRGETDFPTFCAEAAAAGVEKWVAYLLEKEIRYIDINEDVLLREPIP